MAGRGPGHGGTGVSGALWTSKSLQEASRESFWNIFCVFVDDVRYLFICSFG